MGSKDLHIAEKEFKIMREVEEASHRRHKRIWKLLPSGDWVQRSAAGGPLGGHGCATCQYCLYTIDTFFSGHVQMAGLRGLREGQNLVAYVYGINGV
jgi:hypothetical protein